MRIGADDYVVKPFNPIEVVARAKAVLRRAGSMIGAGVIRVGSLSIDLDSYLVTVEDAEEVSVVALTLTEFRILAHMARTPMKAFTRSELVDACMSGGDALDRTVDSHVSNLRRKLARAGLTDMLPGVRGIGYRLSNP